jgi:hypothetical protein
MPEGSDRSPGRFARESKRSASIAFRGLPYVEMESDADPFRPLRFTGMR